MMIEVSSNESEKIQQRVNRSASNLLPFSDTLGLTSERLEHKAEVKPLVHFLLLVG